MAQEALTTVVQNAQKLQDEATQGSAAAAAATSAADSELEPVLTIIRKRVIADWSREQQIMVSGSLYAEINAFILSLDWQNLIHYEAPTDTPDIGIIFSKLQHEFARRFPAVRPVQSAAVRRIAHNISFLLWSSLNGSLEILKVYNRKRFQFDILKPILLAALNCSNAAIGHNVKLEEESEPKPIAAASTAAAATTTKRKEQAGGSTVNLKVAKRVKKTKNAPNTSMVVDESVNNNNDGGGSSTNTTTTEETITSPFEIPSQ